MKELESKKTKDNDRFEKLKNFIDSIGATRRLLQRSHEQGFLIEGLVLYAAIVDGFCRIALVLKQQLEDNTQDFNEGYIYQNEGNSTFLKERDIYKLCLDNCVFDKDLFDEIEALYDVRNKIIHRFIITEIEYGHLELALDHYELVYQRLWNIVFSLESEQISRGVGMTILGEDNNQDQKEILKRIENKINSKDVKKLTRVLGSKLINNSSKFSKKNERSFIVDEINDEIEIRKEKVRIPPGYASVKEITKWADRKGMLKKCLCGHEKIHHIDIDQKTDKKSLEDYIKECKIDGCDCKKYISKKV